jgi:hypothetical protein
MSQVDSKISNPKMWQQQMDVPQSEIGTLLYLQSSFSQLLQAQVHFTVRVFPRSNQAFHNA